MSDYIVYMLVEMLKGIFKLYGFVYGYGVFGVNMGVKIGIGIYGVEIYL